MKKNILLVALMVVLCSCFFALNVSAGTFGEAQTLPEKFPIGTTIKDTSSQILMDDGAIYPAYYCFKDSKTGTFDFTKVNEAFSKNYTKDSVVKVEIPEGVTALEDYNFTNDKINETKPQLNYVKFPSTLLTITRQAFSGVETLTSVTIPDNVTTIGANAFAGCKKLKTVNISSTSNLATIQGSAFKNTSVESFYFPNSLTTIENYAFAYNENSSLKTLVNFENCGVTVIPKGVFRQCGGLKEVKFPEGLKEINGSEMFTYCNIDVIYLPKGVTITNKIEATSIGKFVYTGTAANLPVNAPDTEIEYENHCVVYFNSIHNISSPEYEFISFVEESHTKGRCSKCGLEQKGETFAPIFGGFMYSIKEDSNEFGLVMLYTVNKESKELYEKNTGKSLSYGVMAIAKKTITDENDVVSNPLNSNGTVNCSNIVATAIEKDIGSVTLVIKGSGTAWNEAKDTEFYVTGYVTDGSNLQYFTTNASASLSSLATVTYSQYV